MPKVKVFKTYYISTGGRIRTSEIHTPYQQSAIASAKRVDDLIFNKNKNYKLLMVTLGKKIVYKYC